MLRSGWKLGRRVALGTIIFGLLSGNALRADLVAHFNANDLRTMFQGGFEDNRFGTVPVVALGDPVGWMMDTRVPSVPTPDPDNGQDTYIDAQQGNPNNQPLLGYHPNRRVLNYIDTAENDNLLVLRNNNQKADGLGAAADNNFGTLIVAGRIDPNDTGLSYLVDFRDDAPIAGGVDANDGFGIRYNHATQSFEGMVKQSVATSVPVSAGLWFVASLKWDGANTSATLDVTTRDGIFSDTGTAESVALNADRFRIGNNAAGGAGGTVGSGLRGQIGEFRFYNDIDNHSSVVSQLATQFVHAPELLVDRATGNVSIVVPSAASSITNVVGYSITSASGAIDAANWLSIADNYDAGNPGLNQVDPDNQWTKLSSSTSRTDLSELEFQANGGANNGADFLSGGTLNLGNIWRKHYLEDFQVELALNDGSYIPLYTRFTGNGGLPFQLGDLNFDGVIDEDDFFDIFVPNFGTDTSTLEFSLDQYRVGDLDQSGTVDLVDFHLLNEAYLAANPGAAALSFTVQVPEPSTLVLCGMLALAAFMRRVRPAALFALVLLVVLPQQSDAAVGGVLDVKFDHLAPGTIFNNETRIQDFSGNRYHGFWGGGAVANGAQLQTAFPGGPVVLNNGASNGYMIMQPNLADGGPEAPNAWWGTGNTPAPYFSIEADKSYTFEMVVNWNNGGASVNGPINGLMGFTRDGAAGLPEWWIRENNGSLQYVFDDGPNRQGITGNQINISSLINNDDWHHLAITLARNPSQPTEVVLTTYFDYQEIHSHPVPGAFGAIVYQGTGTGEIRLGAYNANATNRFNGLSSNFRISDEVLDVSQFLPIIQRPEYVLEVDTASGSVTLINDTGIDLVMDSYRLTSELGSLTATGWSSLEAQDFEGQGPNSGWTELGRTSHELSEGFFGGSSAITSPSTINFGQIYTNLGSEDPTLQFEYHVPGTGAAVFQTATVRFVVGVAVPGDYNGDGVVNAADYTVWRDSLGQAGASLPADGNGDGVVNDLDYTFWKQRFGNTAGSGAMVEAQAVPEPTSIAMLAAILLLGMLGRCRRAARGALFATCCLSVGSLAQGEVFSDRLYTLGDDPFEGAVAGASVGSVTYDSVGVNLAAFPGAINSGAYQDLVVAGSPTYVNVGPSGLQRPGAGVGGVGTLGITLNGTDDRLSSAVSLNSPSVTYRTESLFPKGTDNLYDPPSATGSDGTGDGLYRPAFPHNYAGINQRGIQAWVRPDPAALGQSQRQDIVIDTANHGIFITANDTWGFLFNNASIDSGVPVATTLDANGWAHVMSVGGISPSYASNSAAGGSLLVNGTVVATSNAVYNALLVTGLSIGSNLAGTDNFFQGTLDDVELFLWSDNSHISPAAGNQSLGYLGGADWGAIDASDNDWIRQQLAAIAASKGVPSIPIFDVNLDGVVSGNGTGPAATDDVTAFIAAWGYRSEGVIPAGDWLSRQNGDLNFDGVTDIRDARLLRDALTTLGSGSFDFALLASAQVPEPTAVILAVLAAAGTLFSSRGRRLRRS